MPIFNRIRCPKCHMSYDVRSKNCIKQFICKNEECKNKINVNGHTSVYYIVYHFEGRRFRKKIGPSKSLAETVYQKVMVEIAEEKHLDKRKKVHIKFKDFSDKYLKKHSMKRNKSWKWSDAVSIKILNKYFANKYLHEISSCDIEKFQDARAKDVSNATINRNVACLSSMFNKAIKWGQFDNMNPVKKVEFLKENNRRDRCLEKEEQARLLRNANEKLRPILVVALNTGMRRGEILGLKWEDIEFQHNVMHLYETKNGEQRNVPMNKHVKEEMTKLHRHSRSEYVFTHEDGSQIRDVRKSFFTALEKSGINNFRFHDLRHCFCSNLAIRGVDLNTIRVLVGHKSMAMTLRYSHAPSSHKQKAVNVLDDEMDSIFESNDMVVTPASQGEQTQKS